MVVRASRNPAAVRQAGLPGRRRIAIRHRSVRGAVGQAWAEVRGELAWRAYRRIPGFTGPLLVRLTGFMGRRLAGASQQLAVVVVLDLDRYGFARCCRFVLFLVLRRGRLIAVVESVGMAPRQAVRVTAEAGVATFHQIPPGP